VLRSVVTGQIFTRVHFYLKPFTDCSCNEQIVSKELIKKHNGLDYAGPLLSKISPSSSTQEKLYILILTCMATRAIYLELVISTTTANFLCALRRFIASMFVLYRFLNHLSDRHETLRSCWEYSLRGFGTTFLLNIWEQLRY